MREFAVPPRPPLPATANLLDAVYANAVEHPAEPAFSKPVDGGWHVVTWAEFLADVLATARGLIGWGVRAGDRVALMCKTRYEWTVVDYAIWHAGAMTVPIYETSSAEQVDWILADSGAAVVIVETSEHLATVRSVVDRRPGLRTMSMADEELAGLIRAGVDVADDVLDARRAAVLPATIATLIYTSGTTGRPKACTLTQGNFLSELDSATAALPELFAAPRSRTLIFLPLAHVFARVVAIGCVQSRVQVRHSASASTVLDDLGDFRPTFLLSVPRVFENLFHAASTRAAAAGRGRLFESAVATAVAYSRAQDRGGPSLALRARHRFYDRRIYAPLRARLGGELRYAVSGAAPLGERLAHFYRGSGITILDGYGLTESTAALTVNQPRAQRIGTVGRPLPRTSVRVAADGELMFRGRQVFSGYWNDPSATAATLVDGWLLTGDVGELDGDGYVRVTGRKNEILVTAGGKNVAPAVLEERVRASPLVAQCMVVGDGRPFVAALVTLDAAGLSRWQSTHHRSGSLSVMSRDAAVLGEVQAAVDDANSAVSQAEAIRRFVVLDVEWTERTGELTPTSKVRRHVVLRRFHADVEALYE